MSVTASIDIKFGNRKELTISKVQLIKLLFDYGWTFSDNGKVIYLPIGDEGLFKWQSENISIA